MKSFKATGTIGDGLEPILYKSAPLVALFSSRGPNIRDYSFRDADLLKPDILAPGSLIWASWSPNGTDDANYLGTRKKKSQFDWFHLLVPCNILGKGDYPVKCPVLT